MEVQAQVREIMMELLDLDRDELQDDVELYAGLGVDSTETVELVLALEKFFGIRITKEEITKFSKIGEITRVIQGKLHR